MNKVDSTQEQMGSEAAKWKSEERTEYGVAVIRLCPLSVSHFYVVNFLSLSSKKPRAVKSYADTSISILLSQEESLRSYIHNHSLLEDPH